jgi:hypothetical protein
MRSSQPFVDPPFSAPAITTPNVIQHINHYTD